MPVPNRGKDWQVDIDGEKFAGKVSFNINPDRSARRAYNRGGGAMTSHSDNNGATFTMTFLRTDKDNIAAWDALAKAHADGTLGQGSCRHIPTGLGGAMEGVTCLDRTLEDDEGGDTITVTGEVEHYKPTS